MSSADYEDDSCYLRNYSVKNWQENWMGTWSLTFNFLEILSNNMLATCNIIYLTVDFLAIVPFSPHLYFRAVPSRSTQRRSFRWADLRLSSAASPRSKKRSGSNSAAPSSLHLRLLWLTAQKIDKKIIRTKKSQKSEKLKLLRHPK